MIKNFFIKILEFLGIENDLQTRTITCVQKNALNDFENSDDSNIFKVPKYLERAIFIGSILMINSIIYNLIVFPIKYALLMMRIILWQVVDYNIVKINSIKMILIIAGSIVRMFLETKFPSFQIYHKLRYLSGMKIFTFIKILEFLNILLNKFNVDYDLQIIKLLRNTKLKKKMIIILIMIISLSLNIITFWCYIITISITLNDTNNFIYPLFLKLNFIEIKKSGKLIKFKKISETILNGNPYLIFQIYKNQSKNLDIYDRFNILTCLTFVMIQNVIDGKLNSHNFIDYGYRVFFLILSEILFDWIKDIIIFKISCIRSKYLKSFTLDIAVFHDKMKYNCFQKNETKNGLTSIYNNSNSKFVIEEDKNLAAYLDYLEDYNLKYVNKDKLEKYLYFIDFENLLTIELKHNVLVICIIILCHMKPSLELFRIKIFIYIIILLLFRKITQMNITTFVTTQFIKSKEKNQNCFGKANSKYENTSDDCSELSEQIVFS